MNPWILGSALVVALVLLAVTLSLLYYTRPEETASPGQSTAVFNVIPGPTATAAALPTVAFSQTVEAATPAAPAPGEIGIGAAVQVTGTGGDGLRLRSTPGLEGETLLLGAEGEVFTVQDGPREVDGYTWWYVVSLDDDRRKGWGVADFLTMATVETP
jgi:hypothetical protein